MLHKHWQSDIHRQALVTNKMNDLWNWCTFLRWTELINLQDICDPLVMSCENGCKKARVTWQHLCIFFLTMDRMWHAKAIYSCSHEAQSTMFPECVAKNSFPYCFSNTSHQSSLTNREHSNNGKNRLTELEYVQGRQGKCPVSSNRMLTADSCLLHKKSEWLQ